MLNVCLFPFSMYLVTGHCMRGSDYWTRKGGTTEPAHILRSKVHLLLLLFCLHHNNPKRLFAGGPFWCCHSWLVQRKERLLSKAADQKREQGLLLLACLTLSQVFEAKWILKFSQERESNNSRVPARTHTPTCACANNVMKILLTDATVYARRVNKNLENTLAFSLYC